MDVMYILDACVWRLVEAARPMALLSMKVRMSSSMVLVVPRQWHGRYPFPVRPTPSRYAVNGSCERCSNCFRLAFDVSLGVAIDVDVLTFADISFHAWVSYSVRLDGQGRKSGCFQRWVDMDFPKIHSLGKSHLVCQSIKVQDGMVTNMKFCFISIDGCVLLNLFVHTPDGPFIVGSTMIVGGVEVRVSQHH